MWLIDATSGNWGYFASWAVHQGQVQSLIYSQLWHLARFDQWLNHKLTQFQWFNRKWKWVKTETIFLYNFESKFSGILIRQVYIIRKQFFLPFSPLSSSSLLSNRLPPLPLPSHIPGNSFDLRFKGRCSQYDETNWVIFSWRKWMRFWL